jgi:hypothetical protein
VLFRGRSPETQTISMLSGFGYSSSSASHPVGSTFRIQGFLQPLPVRREVARKGASKTILGIKKLLYNYAYARPSVRFALKVLQANNERANWGYGPSVAQASLQDATAKIAGQEVAAQCELKSADFQQTVPQSAAQDFYSIDAVIVKTDAGMCARRCPYPHSLIVVQSHPRSTTSDIIYQLMAGPSTQHEASLKIL